MGSRELIESLRKTANERFIAVRRDAEAEAQRIRDEVVRKIEGARQEQKVRQAVEEREKSMKILSEAGNRVRVARLTAEKRTSERFFSLTLSSLKQLRDEGYRDIFSSLVKELPPLPWKTVRVNPGDRALAEEFFPAAEVVPDAAITGGVDVAIEGGKMRIVNTFEKRLERAWEEILPSMLKDLYEEVATRGIA